MRYFMAELMSSIKIILEQRIISNMYSSQFKILVIFLLAIFVLLI